MRRSLALLLVGTGIYPGGRAVRPARPAPAPRNRRPRAGSSLLTARDYSFSPNRVEVQQDDLIKLTVQSADVAYGFTIDDYRCLEAGAGRGLDRRLSSAPIGPGPSRSIRT